MTNRPERQISRRERASPSPLRVAIVLLLVLGVSGCVSKSLNQSDFANEAASVGNASNVTGDQISGQPQELGYATNSRDGQGTGPDSAASGDVDPQARAKAVAEMRAKAQSSGANPPSAYKQDDPALEPKSPAEVRQLQQDLQSAAQRNENRITDAELSAKQDSIRRLKQRANSHYNDALQKIEN